MLLSGVSPAFACPPKEVQSSYENNGIKFEVQDCQRQAKKVTCGGLITSTEKDLGDVRLSVNSGSMTRMIDSSGNEYTASIGKIGNKESREVVNSKLTKDVPMKMIVVFADVPSDVKDIASLEIDVYGSSSATSKLLNLKIK